MTQPERGLGEPEERFSKGAVRLTALVERFGLWEDLEQKLEGSNWFLFRHLLGLGLVSEREGGKYRLVVSFETDSLAVRRWESAKVEIPQQRIDARDSSWAVFPRYAAGNNVFDEMRLIGEKSLMGLFEVNEVLEELIELVS